MGVISILLGIITFFCLTGVGAIFSNKFMSSYAFLGFASPTQFVAVIVGVFAFIGLLIGMNLVMHGVNYNRLTKLQKRLKRR